MLVVQVQARDTSWQKTKALRVNSINELACTAKQMLGSNCLTHQNNDIGFGLTTVSIAALSGFLLWVNGAVPELMGLD